MPVMLEQSDKAAIIGFALGVQLDAEKIASIFPARCPQRGEVRDSQQEASARKLLADCLAAVAENISTGAMSRDTASLVPFPGSRRG